MAINVTQQIVTTVAALVYTSVGKSTLVLYSPGAEIYIGHDSGVTPGNGFQLSGGLEQPLLTLALSNGDAIYAIRAHGAATLYMIATK